MTEKQLQKALGETTNFLQRQRLLKQLWKLHRQREADVAATRSTGNRQSSPRTPPLTAGQGDG